MDKSRENHIIERIDQAIAHTVKTSGCSDVLFDSRMHETYLAILAESADADRAATEALLIEQGYNPDYVPYEAQEGECSLTGIDENCCPCGRHP